MIPLTKISGEPFFLNSDLIETVHSAPDTVITLTNGKKMLVAESPEEIQRRFLEYRRQIFLGLRLIKDDGIEK